MLFRPLPVRRVDEDGRGMRGHIVSFLAMPHPDNPFESVATAIVVWQGGGITGEGLSRLVFIGSFEEEASVDEQVLADQMGEGG